MPQLRRTNCQSSFRSSELFSVASTDSEELSPTTSSPSAKRPDAANGLYDMPAMALSDKQVDRLSCELAKSPAIQSAVQSRYRKHGPPQNPELKPALTRMFSSASITDPKMLGSPINMHSKEFILPSEGLKVGECKYLNPAYGNSEGCSLSTQVGKDGRPRFFLSIGSKLIGMQSGTTEFILASRIDVTSAVRELAVARWKRHPNQKPLEENLEINWLAYANEERLRSPGLRGTQQLWPADKHLEKVCSSDADLAEFFDVVQEVRDLHRDYFVLKPPRSQSAYDIAWVSETLFDDQDAQERIVNQLRMMPTKVLHEFVQATALGNAFSLLVSLKHTAKSMRMYCVPMFQPPKLSSCVCFLVD